jgi:hypothetical protein
VQRLARLADALLARTKRAKIFSSSGRHIGKQLKLDAAGLGVGDRDVEEHLRTRFRCEKRTRRFSSERWT